VQVNNPKNEPNVAVVKLEYKFRLQAVHAVSDITGDCDARTRLFLLPIQEEKKFNVPFVIDDIQPRVIVEEDLVVIHIIGKKHRLVFDINNK
jgi:hypothetical protein